MIRYLLYTIGDLTDQSPLVRAYTVEPGYKDKGFLTPRT